MTTKPTKRRNMRIFLSYKPKGKRPASFQLDWAEPEDMGLDTFHHFHERIQAMVKEHGLMDYGAK